MTNERGSLFEGEDLDLEGFEAKKNSTNKGTSTPKKATPPKSAVQALAAKAGFTPRSTRRSRRKRTGRTEQLNIKVTPEIFEKFYRLADANEWVLGELLEHALPALERELEEEQKS